MHIVGDDDERQELVDVQVAAKVPPGLHADCTCVVILDMRAKSIWVSAGDVPLPALLRMGQKLTEIAIDGAIEKLVTPSRIHVPNGVPGFPPDPRR